MPHPLVVHKDHRKFDTYIGRPSKWGNPFVIGRDGTREEVIAKYRDLLPVLPGRLEEIRTELRGHKLGCFCAPQPCHGDVLAAIATPADWRDDFAEADSAVPVEPADERPVYCRMSYPFAGTENEYEVCTPDSLNWDYVCNWRDLRPGEPRQ